jgi:hypothetical protein
MKCGQEPVVHTCNLNYFGGCHQKNCNLKTAWANSLQDSISTGKKLGMVVCAYYPRDRGKHKEEDHGPGWPGKKARPYLQNNRNKKV